MSVAGISGDRPSDGFRLEAVIACDSLCVGIVLRPENCAWLLSDIRAGSFETRLLRDLFLRRRRTLSTSFGAESACSLRKDLSGYRKFAFRYRASDDSRTSGLGTDRWPIGTDVGSAGSVRLVCDIRFARRITANEIW